MVDESSSSSSSSNEFSRENMIGMFLALQLCQLTQPYGSLLFCGDGGGGGFFWRCNPIASLVEGLIIFRYLGVTVWEARQESWGVIFLRLQAMAGALLLTRSGTPVATDADGHTNQAELSDEDMPEESSDDADILKCESQRAQRQMLRGAFGADTLAHRELRIGIMTTVAALLLIIKSMSVSGVFIFTIAGVLMFLGWMAVQVLLMLLHVRQMEDPEIMAAGRTAVRLGRTFLQDVRSWQLLFSYLHLPVFGWPSYLAASRPWFPGETGFAQLARNLLSLASLVISYMSLYFTGAGGVFVLFDWLQNRRQFTIYPTSGMGGYRVIALVPLLSWGAAASASYYLRMSGVLNRSSAAWPAMQDDPSLDILYTFTSFFDPGTVLYYIVDEAFEFTGRIVIFLIILFLLTFPYLAILSPELIGLDVKDKDVAGTRVSVGSLLFTLGVFSAYLLCYDSSGTHKASWTEVLG